jgi:NAD(P)-dependent dehydrogenase (short-subunit alcohol dehydrogenase family)
MTTEDFSARPGAALVTGGSGGLGSAVARMLAARGSNLAITYRLNDAGAASVVADAEALGRRARAWQLDLVDVDATRETLSVIAERFGGIHTLVHAAGPHVPQIHLSRVDPARFKQQVEEEVVAFFNLVQPALPYLRDTAGCIVAITTAATRRYPVRDGLSAGPKSAIETLVRGIAAEEGRYGIRANCVGPGMLTDGMAARLIASGDLDDEALDVTIRNIALRRFGEASDVAEAVCFLASDRARFITGQLLAVDGGYGI